MLVMAGLYLRGVDLDPVVATQVLEIEPTTSQRNGERRVAGVDKEYVAKTGLWGLVVKQSTHDVSEVVSSLLRQLNGRGDRLKSIEHVEDAYVDVFVAIDSDAEGSGNCCMELPHLYVDALAALGLPLRITVSMGRS
jgi:hypothetical protein